MDIIRVETWKPVNPMVGSVGFMDVPVQAEPGDEFTYPFEYVEVEYSLLERLLQSAGLYREED